MGTLALEMIAQHVAVLWAVSVGPYNTFRMVGATLHARGYTFGLVDWMTGICIYALIVLGLPPLSAF